MIALAALKRFGMSKWPLRAKIMLAIQVAIFVPVIGAVVFAVGLRYNDGRARTFEDLQRVAEIASTQVNQRYTTAQQQVQRAGDLLTQDRQIRSHAIVHNSSSELAIDNQYIAQTEAVLRTELLNIIGTRAIRLIDDRGQLLAIAGDTTRLPGLLDADQAQSDLFQQIERRGGLSEDEVYRARPYSDPVTNQPYVEFAMPIVDGVQRTQAYLVFTLDDAWLLDQPLNYLRSAHSGLVEDLYLVMADGTLLTPVGEIEPLRYQFDLDLISRSIRSVSGTTTYLSLHDADPTPVMGGYAPLAQNGWIAITELEEATLNNALLEQGVLRGGLLVALVFLFAMGVAVMVLRVSVVPVERLAAVASDLAYGNLRTSDYLVERRDASGQLARALNTLSEQLRQATDTFSSRVQARTYNIESILLIIRELAATAALRDLLSSAVHRLVERFPKIYHAQVFLIDARGDYAVLVASTGEAGQQLLEARHRLAVGSISVIGRVTETGQLVVAGKAATSRVHRRNEFLPETRAEMALPLMHGGRILGALDLQSKEAGAFSSEDQQLFTILAEQIALTIARLQLFEDVEKRAIENERQLQMLTRKAWDDVLQTARRRGQIEARASQDESAITTSPAAWSQWQREAMRLGRLVTSPPQNGSRIMAMPIMQREQVIGAVEWTIDADADTEHARQLAQQLTNRLATTLETIRLLERSERLAGRERLVNEISGKLTAQPDVSNILQTAVQELSRALHTAQVSIRLKSGETGPPDESGPPGESKPRSADPTEETAS